MALSCSIDAYVKNKNGDTVVSNLWTDLMKFTDNDRTLTKQYYALGTSPDFLKSVGRKAEFDENGQITFASLKKLAKLKFSEDKILEKVRGSFGASALSFEDAVDSVNSFNSQSQFKGKYMATIVEETDGTYTTDVVPRNKVNEDILKEMLKKKKLRDFLIDRLKALHCNVEFIDNPNYRGRYSTENVEKLYDSTYTLIRLAKGLPIDLQTKVLAKEIGHFIVGVLGEEDPLIKRLSDALKPSVIEAYNVKYEDGVILTNEKREVMGHLIGEAVYNNLEGRNTPIDRLLNRIKAKVFYMFRKYRNEAELMDALVAMESILDKAARGFIKKDSKYDVENALKAHPLVRETLYDSVQNTVYQQLKAATYERQRLANLIKGQDYKLGKQIQDKVDELINNFRDNNTNSEADLRFLRRAVLLALNDIELDLIDAQFSLNNIQRNTDFAIKQGMMKYSKDVYLAGARVMSDIRSIKLLESILNSGAFNSISQTFSEISSVATDTFVSVNGTFNKTFDDIDNANDETFREITERSRSFTRTSGYYESNGTKYVRYHRLQDVDEHDHKIPSDVESAALDERSESTTIRGSRTDAFLRVIFSSKDLDPDVAFEQAFEAANSDDAVETAYAGKYLFEESSKDYLKNLQNQALNLMRIWASRGIKWKSEDLMIGTTIGGLRIAGELDILLKYPDGTLEVWDIKTTDKDPSNEYSPKNNINYTTQLNFYAMALRNAGYKVRVGGIIQVLPQSTRGINTSFAGTPLLNLYLKQDKAPEDLQVQYFQHRPIPFIEALKAQYDVETNKGTIASPFQTPRKAAPLRSFIGKTKEEIENYVRQYKPLYSKAVHEWFIHQPTRNLNTETADEQTNTSEVNKVYPYRVLERFGIMPANADLVVEDEEHKVGARISSIKDRVRAISNTTTNAFNSLCERISCLWLEDIYGSDTIKTASKGLRFGYTEDSPVIKSFYLSEDTYKTSQEVLGSIEKDLNWIEFLFHPMSRTRDIPTQMLAKMVDTMNTTADRKTFEITRRLLDLKKKYKLSRREEIELYERDEKGNLTGNFIGEVHYGRYEEDLKELKQTLKTNFQEELVRQGKEHLDEDTKAILFARYKSKEWKKFHSGTKGTAKDEQGNTIVVTSQVGHSVKKDIIVDGVKVDTIYVPNPEYRDKDGNLKYRNFEYDKLTQKQKDFLREILEIKEEQDALLGNRAFTTTQRAPQIDASKKLDYFTNRTPENIIVKGWRWLCNSKALRSEDNIKFGNDMSEMDKDTWFDSLYLDPQTHISEVPMFFIRKVDDPNRMSTKVIESMVAYTSMAQSYYALSSVSHMIELLYKKFTSRKFDDPRAALSVKAVNPVGDFSMPSVFEDRGPDDHPSRYASGLRSYLEMNLYSKRVQLVKKNRFKINKFLQLMMAMPTMRFLWGNVHGASVNLQTGINEIWKEAVVGEDMSWESALKAHGQFLAWVPAVLLGTPSYKDFGQSINDKKAPVLNYRIQENKVSAWFRYFNARGDNAFQDKHFNQRVFPITFSELMMFPYSAGDFYMQGLSYLAAAFDMKLYDRDGNKVSFFDAYDNDKGILSIQPDKYFMSAEFARDYDTLKAIQVKLQKSVNHIISAREAALTLEEKDLLQRYLGIEDDKFNNLSEETLIMKLEYLFDKNVVRQATQNNEKDKSNATNIEIEYMRKCRALNDRMHGIYNKANKTTMHASVLGSMLMALRGYLLGYIERDWAQTREDATLGRAAEGDYLTFVKYLGYSFSQKGIWQGFLSIFRATIEANLATLPLLSNLVSKGLSKITGKEISYNAFMRAHSDLGDFQINNLKRLASKMNLIALMNFILPQLCLKMDKLQGDDDDDDTISPWLVLYYIYKRAGYEQSAATVLYGTVSSAFSEEGFSTGWVQEINRNSSLVPIQALSALAMYQDVVQITGMFVPYDDPDTMLLQDAGESDAAFKDRKKAYDKKHNAFWLKTHYNRNNMSYQRDIDGQIIEIDGEKIPVYDTPFKRAVHGEYKQGDPKFYKNLVSILPYIKSIRIFEDPIKAVENWMYGQKVRKN